MAVKRLYRCNECGFQFEHFHMDKREALLDACPNDACVSHEVIHDVDREREEGEARIARMVESGIAPGRTTHKSTAMKHAEKAMLQMGMTDMNDTGRQGDRAAKSPTPPGAAEIQAMTREMVEAKAINSAEQAEAFAKGASTFWTHNDPAQKAKLAEAAARNPMAAAIQRAPMVAAGAAADARRNGIDPIKMLHDGEKKSGGMKLDVVAGVKG